MAIKILPAILLVLAALTGTAPAVAQGIAPDEIETIGLAMVEAAGTSDAKIVLFGRFDDRFSATTLRYRADGSDEVEPAFLGDPAARELVAIWRRERAAQGDEVWREMIFVVDHGEVDLTLRYPDQVDRNSTYSEAATAVEDEAFGTPE